MGFQYPTGAPAPVAEPKGPPQAMLIFIGLIVLVVLAGVALGAVILLQPPAAGPQETVSFEIPTAREGYPEAITLARQNDSGAVLASAVGAWRPTISTAALTSGRTGWTYYIYFPSTQLMAAVVVDRKGNARVASSQKWQTPPDALDENQWAIDSPAGMATFLQKCQGDLNASADRQVEAVFSTDRSAGSLSWHIMVTGPDETPVCEILIDAVTGQVK
jgi:hypothetical protein